MTPENAQTQYGVQIVWSDPVDAGAVKPGERYSPRWQHFTSREQADAFASIYLTQLDNGVAAVNRAERWAVVEYGPWVDSNGCTLP